MLASLWVSFMAPVLVGLTLHWFNVRLNRKPRVPDVAVFVVVFIVNAK